MAKQAVARLPRPPHCNASGCRRSRLSDGPKEARRVRPLEYLFGMFYVNFEGQAPVLRAHD